jgi:hypothetical protein
MRSTLSDYSANYNTLAALKKTEEAMKAEQSLESAVTETQDNSAEVLAGYQAQAQQVTQTQQEFSDYMERLHEDIDARAEKFGYVEYFDASLRDKKARDTAVAADNVNLLDERRKPLAEVNPLLAQNSELPPEPNIEQEAYEYAGINLNAVAQEALDELNQVENTPVSHTSGNPAESGYGPQAAESTEADPASSGEAPQGAGPEQAEAPADDEENVTFEEVEALIESLLEEDVENQYGVQDLASYMMSLKKQRAQASGEEIERIQTQLEGIYEAARTIQDKLNE